MSYPTTYDNFETVYSEKYLGYAIEETFNITQTTGNLKHLAKENSIAISGFTEVATTPNENEFQITDYSVPVNSRTSIDYNCGKAIVFNSLDIGRIIKITYTTPGDYLTADLFNSITTAINNIQTTLGRLGSNKDLDISPYTTVFEFVRFLYSFLKTHDHTGGTATTATPKLSANSFDTTLTKFTNEHIASDAAIEESKLEA